MHLKERKTQEKNFLGNIWQKKILVFGIVNPLFKWWLKKQTQNEGYAADVAKITSEFITLRKDYAEALELTKKAKWRPDRYFKGVELLIAKRVHLDDER